MTHRLPLLLLTLSLLFAFSTPAHAADSAISATRAGWSDPWMYDSATPAASSGPLAVLKTIPLGGDGGWDYLTVDSSNHRLFIARSNRVMVVDLLTDKLLAEIPDTPGCHGIALDIGSNKGYVTSAGKRGDPTGNVVVFDMKTLKVLNKIPVGNRPDAIIYVMNPKNDLATPKVFAFNHGDGTVTVIEPAPFAGTKPINTTIDIGGTLEYGTTENLGHVFVDVEDKSEVVAIDSIRLKVLSHWSISPAKEPTGLDIDGSHNRLFVATSGSMVVLNSSDGKVVATLPTGNGVDGCAYDLKPGLLLSANGKDGTVTVIHEDTPDKFSVVQTLPTAKGARTIALDPQTHRFYLPCNVTDKDGKPTFGLVVVGPKEK